MPLQHTASGGKKPKQSSEWLSPVICRTVTVTFVVTANTDTWHHIYEHQALALAHKTNHNPIPNNIFPCSWPSLIGPTNYYQLWRHFPSHPETRQTPCPSVSSSQQCHSSYRSLPRGSSPASACAYCSEIIELPHYDLHVQCCNVITIQNTLPTLSSFCPNFVHAFTICFHLSQYTLHGRPIKQGHTFQVITSEVLLGTSLFWQKTWPFNS